MVATNAVQVDYSVCVLVVDSRCTKVCFSWFVLAPVVLHLFTIIAVLHFHRLTQMGCLVLVYSTPKTKQLLQTQTLFLF